MEKPIRLKLKEFKNNLVTLINTSGLPLFVVEPIMKDILQEVQIKMEQEYQQDKMTYENSLAQEQENNKTEAE